MLRAFSVSVRGEHLLISQRYYFGIRKLESLGYRVALFE